MIKKTAGVLLLCLLVLVPLGAQTTWMEQYLSALPHSMLSYVSMGLAYDRMDTIVWAPAELGDWEGTEVYTAYGNYEEWNGAPTPINPFTTTFLTPSGQLLLGILGPLMGFHGGILSGFTFDKADNLGVIHVTNAMTSLPAGINDTLTSGTPGSFTATETSAIDAGLDGVVDYTRTHSATITDYTETSTFDLGAGVDLGFLGASVSADITQRLRSLGGSYVYTWAAGTTAAGADQIMNKTVYYGPKEQGKVGLYTPATPSTWRVTATAQLPLSFPLTARLALGSQPTTMVPALGAVPKTVSYTTLNPTGAIAGTSDSLTYTIGSTGNEWDDAIVADREFVMPGAPTLELRNQALTAVGLADANDPTRTKNTNFTSEIMGQADPSFEIQPGLRLKGRVAVDYELSTSNSTWATTHSVTFTEATDVAGASSTFTFSRSVLQPKVTTTNTLGGEVGGVLEFTGSGILTVRAGGFYLPNIATETIVRTGGDVTTEDRTWRDNSSAPNADATNLTTYDQIEPNTARGSSTYNQTKAYSANEVTTTFTHQFVLPTSATIELMKDRLLLTGGYALYLTRQNEVAKIPASITTTTTTVLNAAGAQVSPTTTSAAATTTTAARTDQTVAGTNWAGLMSFMLRWLPVPSLVVDVYGQTIINALDFSVFGTSASLDGFNPSTLISNLGLSVTYRFPPQQ